MKSQSQAMLNLNLKLHSSVLKGQVKTIELDLRKLDANQAIERLSIIRVRTACFNLSFSFLTLSEHRDPALHPAIVL